jgi:hypothetical protein
MAMVVMGGTLSAALSLLYLAPIPPGFVFLSYLASLPLFLLGLGVGLRSLYGAGLLATILIFLLEGPFIAGQFLVFSALGPTFLINRALLRRTKSSGEVAWYPSSFLLRDFTLYSGIIMLLALGAYLYITQTQDVHLLAKNLLKSLDPHQQMTDMAPLLLKILPTVPGIIALSWGMMMMLNGALAQTLLVQTKRNLRSTPRLKDLEAPQSFLILLGLSLLLSVIGVGSLEILGKNAAIVLIFPFFLIGLGLIHKWLQQTPYTIIWLTIFYVLLLVFIWLALIVIVFGIIKPWIKKSAPSN